mmetsp:Transcript_4492/g.9851  ORF Transcript_4492/g.9851 Transcript_4492/m.9851 type:complete len:305 (+) Transcript_4492:3128-4042(+)
MGSIPNAMTRGNNHNCLPLRLRSRSQIHCHFERRSRTWTHHDTLGISKLGRPLDGFIAGRTQEFADMSPWTFFVRLIRRQIREKVGRYSRPNTKYGMRGMRFTEMYTRFGRFDANDFAIGILLNEVLSDSRGRATGAHSGNEVIHAFPRLLPNFDPGSFVVNPGIGFVVKLIGEEVRSCIFRDQFLRVDFHARHAFRGCGKVNICAEHTADNVPFLEGWHLGHDDDAFVSLGGTYHGKPNAGISAGVFDDRHSWLERAVFFGGFDHAFGDAIFDGAAWVLHLEFDEDAGIIFLGCGGKDSVDTN